MTLEKVRGLRSKEETAQLLVVNMPSPLGGQHPPLTPGSLETTAGKGGEEGRDRCLGLCLTPLSPGAPLLFAVTSFQSGGTMC